VHCNVALHNRKFPQYIVLKGKPLPKVSVKGVMIQAGWMDAIRFSLVISRVSALLNTRINLMMETEPVSKTLVFNSALTQLIALEDFIAFIHRESFRSYIGRMDHTVILDCIK
jgi:hypothetical protein